MAVRITSCGLVEGRLPEFELVAVRITSFRLVEKKDDYLRLSWWQSESPVVGW